MIDGNHTTLSIVRQCALINLSRTSMTYVRMQGGFVYLVAVMGWYSRKVLSWEVSNSMDGKGRWIDNVFIYRLLRSVKYEDIYIKEYGTVLALRNGLRVYFKFYNNERPHQSFGIYTPSEVYSGLYEAAE